MNADLVKGFITLVYLGGCLWLVIYVVVLLRLFVRAHERMADGLESVARKFRDDGKS